jgi:choice-of-anchor C domain-containing protein
MVLGDVTMRARILGAAAAVSLCVAAFPAAAAVNLIQNGSFESGLNPGGVFNTLSSGDTSIDFWTVGGSIDYIHGYWPAQDGNRSLDLNGSDALGSVKQDFNVVNGGKYTVSFWLAGNPDGPPTIKQVGVDVNGGFQTFTFDSSGSSLGDLGWKQYSFGFTAIGTTETLKFVSLDCGNPDACSFGAALDNVSVTAAPELSTWGMMLLGFAGIGLVAYRRARQGAADIAAT